MVFIWVRFRKTLLIDYFYSILIVISFLLGSPLAELPDFVVINMTPFLPCVPYNVAAASPLRTLTASMLLGSISKNRDDPLLPSTKLP